MKDQDIEKNRKEEAIQEMKIETLPILMWLQLVFYTLGIIVLIRLFFNNKFWGNTDNGLVFGIGLLIFLLIMYLRANSETKKRKKQEEQ